MDTGVGLYDPALGRFLEVDPVAGGSANDYDYCSGDPINCFDLAGTMKTPENKSSANDFFAYLAQHPEVVAYLTALSVAPTKPAAPKPEPVQPSLSSGVRGPAPMVTNGGGGHRGPDPCHCPAPTGPRTGALDTVGCTEGIAGGLFGMGTSGGSALVLIGSAGFMAETMRRSCV